MTIALAACLLELPETGTEVHLLPAGEFRAIDGRPADAPHWILPADRAAALSRRLADYQTPRVIDYEHQTLHAEHNGHPAPAAGWFHRVAFRDTGLYAVDVDWTERAKGLIAAREYRFISPVFTYEPGSGVIQDLLHAALTNIPALDGLAAVAARLSTLLPEACSMTDDLMDRLRYLLNVPPTTSPAEMAAELQKLIDLLNADPSATTAETRLSLPAWITALKNATPDPAQYIPVAALSAVQTELAALQAKIAGDELERLIEGALKDGRLLPPLKDWARDLGAKNLAALQSYLDKAHPIAALTGMQTAGRTPSASPITLTRTDFDRLSPRQAREHLAAGGRIAD